MAKTISEQHQQHLNVLINNAGHVHGQSLDNYSEEQWDKTLALNLKAPFYLTKAFRKHLRLGANQSAIRSKIINIGSIDGLRVPAVDNFAYAPSKAGLHHLTRTLASKLASDGINVNSIASGAFETEMLKPHLNRVGKDNYENLIPLKRLGTPDDIVSAIIYLSAKSGEYLTGMNLVLDGGFFGATADP